MFVDLVSSEDVLKAVTMRGPMIPMEIRKFLGKGDSITIGAELSTLLKKGAIRVTSVKMGGSPFYYVRGQEPKLELLNKYLNDKDKRAFEDLRDEKVLKDSSLEPLMRVSLRSIPDFAKKVELTRDNETVLYWRWYLISEDDALALIHGRIQKKDLSSLDNKESSQSAPSQINSEPQVDVSKKEVEVENQAIIKTSLPESSSSQNQVVEPKSDVAQNQEREVEDIKEKKVPEKKERKQPSLEKQKTIEDVSEDVPDFDDAFFIDLKDFFNENNIKIKKAEMIRKGSDYEFVVEMKTPFGETEYFCKAKSKKKCNEGDLSSAYLQGQNKRMPTVFITTGEITKKAKQKARDEYKGLLVKEL